MIATIPPQINEMSTVDALRVLIQGQTKNGGGRVPVSRIIGVSNNQ